MGRVETSRRFSTAHVFVVSAGVPILPVNFKLPDMLDPHAVHYRHKRYHPLTKLNPAWWAVVNLAILAFGIYILHWNFKILIYVFWMEINYVAFAAVIRSFFAKDKRSRFTVSSEKMWVMILGTLLSTACIMFVVGLTFDIFAGQFGIAWKGGPWIAVILMAVNHLELLSVHYFMNDRYLRANPFREYGWSYAYMVLEVGAILAFCLYYMKRFPSFDPVPKLALKLLVIRFLMDLIYSGIIRTIVDWLFPKEDYSKPSQKKAARVD